jgi:hypothetical protein
MSRENPSREWESLLIACIENGCDYPQSLLIGKAIDEDPAALVAYVQEMRIHAMLQWRYSEQPSTAVLEELLPETFRPSDCPQEFAPSGVFASDSAAAQPSDGSAESSPFGFLPTALRSPTAAYFSSEASMAYLLAVFIVGVGLAILSVVPVSQLTQTATNKKSGGEQQHTVAVKHEREIVGQITGMVDCKRTDPDAARSRNTQVVLGQKYVLASGLMEITYHTGGKVILQGPAAYEVESTNGGYLSIGKLTGKVECEAAKGFAVRTPTAIVTDLGTEFGVEVSKHGSTRSYVFRGSVEMRTNPGNKTMKSDVRVLRASESAVVESNGSGRGNPLIAVTTATKPIEFIREVPRSTWKNKESFELVASWRFNSKDFLADSSGHGHTLINIGARPLNNTAFFDGSAMMRTTDSIDLTPYAKVRVSWSQKIARLAPDQIFWEQTPNYCHTPGALVAYLYAGEGYAGVATQDQGKEAYRLEAYSLSPNTWERYVMECDLAVPKRSSIVKLLRNGEVVGIGSSANGPAPAAFANGVFYIGARAKLGSPFVGQMCDMTIEGKKK